MIIRRKAATGLVPKLVTAVIFAAILQLFAGEAMSLEPDWPASSFESAGINKADIVTFGARNQPASVDMPRHAPADLAFGIEPRASVIVVEIDGAVRAYPHQVVATHEVINDELGGVPIAVTYCRVCSASVVFDRRLDGAVTTFHLTGFLNNDNIVLYDSASERWWQQYDGTALNQKEMKDTLAEVGSKVMSFQRFKELHPNDGATVLLATEESKRPLAFGNAPVTPGGAGLPDGVDPLDRVVVIEDKAVPVSVLRDQEELQLGNLILQWQPGRNAAPDLFGKAQSDDVGDIMIYDAKRYGEEDVLLDQAYRIDLAHAFQRFVTGGTFELKGTIPDDPSRLDR